MKFSVLASDSSGNCCFVESKGTKILVDAGMSCKLISERLAVLGESLDSVQAVCFTHDHADHSSAAGTLSIRHNIPLYASYGTSEAVNINLKRKNPPRWQVFEPGNDFGIGSLTIHPFRVPHDASEPVGFVISDGESTLGIATDLGEVPEMVARRLSVCNALLLEFNHELEWLLRCESRPWHLRQRVRGRTGHLSNDQAAELLARLAGPHLRTVFLAHISSECNTVDRAADSAAAALGACRPAPPTRICRPCWPCPLMDV